MHYLLRIILLAVILLTTILSAEPVTLPPHPRLLLNQSEIDALKTKIAGPFADQWARWRADADELLRDPIDLPPRGGNWSHNYVCPEHGARLKRGKAIGPWQWEHICPVGNHVLHGDPAKGVTDFDGYRADPTQPLQVDFFVPDDMPPPKGVSFKPLA